MPWPSWGSIPRRRFTLTSKPCSKHGLMLRGGVTGETFATLRRAEASTTLPVPPVRAASSAARFRVVGFVKEEAFSLLFYELAPERLGNEDPWPEVAHAEGRGERARGNQKDLRRSGQRFPI